MCLLESSFVDSQTPAKLMIVLPFGFLHIMVFNQISHHSLWQNENDKLYRQTSMT